MTATPAAHDPPDPPDQPDPADPAAAAADFGGRVAEATRRMVKTAAGISDAQAREPSPLPGWTRGHLLTHIARNADSLRNLLTWARTGVETPQYASEQARDADIEAGSGRPAAQILADIEASAAALAAEAARLTDADWAAEVHGLRGAAHPAWYTLRRRLTEVEIHHVDLDAGYGPADWPQAFATQWLASVADDFTDPDCPQAALRAADSGNEYVIGPAGGAPATTVTGQSRDLLAWLIGRSDGAGLTADPAGPLPALPAW
jgi:maleylpyruvate isomerase